MQEPHFRIAYDILGEGYFQLSGLFILIWLAISFFGIVGTFLELRNSNFSFAKKKAIFTLIVSILFFGIGLLIIITNTRTQYNCMEAARTGDVETVTGRIEALTTGPKSGESFYVNNVWFSYDFNSSEKCGYYHKRGIALKDGVLVRISHKNGRILKFEVEE